MIFDTHSHCYFEKLAVRIDEVQTNMLASGVTHTVQIGCDVPSSIAAIELAQKYPNWYASVGYHPVDAQDPEASKDRAGGKKMHEGEGFMTGNANPDSPEFRHDQEAGLRALVEKYREHVVAIGETGLDQHYLSDEPAKRAMELEEQYYWFERMAHIARDYGLPLIIHSRDARRETIDAIKRFEIKYAVIHCFSEDADFARELMEYSPDIYFSFSGILTYKNAPDIQAAARAVPLDRILVETDAPFLSPNPVR